MPNKNNNNKYKNSNQSCPILTYLTPNQRFALSNILSFLTETEGTSLLITNKSWSRKILPLFQLPDHHPLLLLDIDQLSISSPKGKEKKKLRHEFIVMPIQDSNVLLAKLNTKRLHARIKKYKQQRQQEESMKTANGSLHHLKNINENQYPVNMTTEEIAWHEWIQSRSDFMMYHNLTIAATATTSTSDNNNYNGVADATATNTNASTATLTLQYSVNIGSLSTGGGARDSAYYIDSSGNYNIYVAGYTDPNGFKHFRVDSLTKLTSNWSGATGLTAYDVGAGTAWGCAVDQDRSYLYIGAYGVDGGVWRYYLNTSDGTPQTSSAQKFSMNSTEGVPVNQAVAYDPWADVLYTGSDYNQSPVIAVRDASDPSSRVGQIQITNNNDWQTSIGCIEVSETKLYFQSNENSHDPSSNPVYAITR